MRTGEEYVKMSICDDHKHTVETDSNGTVAIESSRA